MKPIAAKTCRCAIYTRVSTEHGLEQEFNSLHAQREAAQAYVKSQAHEGWKPIRDHYEDGGYSGGSMERPALQRLLADIRGRRIDILVVYKVDRLTRSLTDFARLVELFDEQGVSFVSVTQSFNTTSSMGRLTLNVLLSFAQFEREVTGERIRDKIAASKKKGLWVGGVVPLGYQVKEKKLFVDEEEAKLVRLMFERYAELGSLPKLQQELRRHGIVTRRRRLSSGVTVGGVHLTNGPLAYLLRNRVYLGEINHRDKSYPGEHPPIIDGDLFDRVQVKLDENRLARRLKNERSDALLLGKLYDDRGNKMTPSFAIKKGVRYRYYVSSVLAQGRKEEAGSVSRIASHAIETLVLEALERPKIDARNENGTAATALTRTVSRAEWDATGGAGISRHHEPDRERNLVEELVERVILSSQSVEIRLREDAEASARSAAITISWSPQTFRRKRELIASADNLGDPVRPIRFEARAKLLAAIAKGRKWLADITSGAVADIETIAAREGLSERSVRMMLSLAFVAPDIVQAAVDGTLPRGFGVSRLTNLPADWTKQRQALGLAAAS